MKRFLPAIFISAMAVALTGETLAESDTSTVLPSGKIQRSVSASASVEAIDLEKRMVVLRRENGTTVTVQVDERVKNLPQVRVGDRVQVNYREAIAFQVKPAGEVTPSVSMKEGLTTARPGEKPAGVGTQEVTIVATIDAINREKPSVFLRTAHGEVTEVQVRQPENLRKVKVGDHVEVTYSMALALSVVAMPSAASGSSAPAARSSILGTTNDLNRKELDRIRAAD